MKLILSLVLGCAPMVFGVGASLLFGAVAVVYHPEIVNAFKALSKPEQVAVLVIVPPAIVLFCVACVQFAKWAWKKSDELWRQGGHE